MNDLTLEGPVAAAERNRYLLIDRRGRLKLVTQALSVFLMLLLVGARSREVEPVTVRVLTYNIHHGEGTDRLFDLARLADVMKSARPDIIALQEVDQGTERAGGVNQLDELADLLGMHGAFGKAMDFSGGGYGVAVLSRWPVLGLDNTPLPASPDHEPRTALTVYVKAGQGGPLLQFTSTHFDQSREASDRVSQATYLNELLAAGGDRPSVLAGDFNARQDTDILAILNAGWTNAASFIPTPPASATQPRRRRPRSDFVLFRPMDHWRVIEAQVIDAAVASDHRPVLAVLEWIGTG